MTEWSTRLARSAGAVLLMIGFFYWQARLGQSFPSWPSAPTDLIPIIPQYSHPSAPPITAPIAYAFAIKSGTTLYASQADQPWPPASTAKLLTALTASEIYSPETLITIDGNDLTLPEKPLFTRGEELLVRDLIETMLVSSSNQAAYILANHAPGGKSAFLAALKEKSESLTLTNTTILDPAGFDTPGQFTTAEDLLKIAKAIMANPTLKSYVALPEAQIAEFNGSRSLRLKSTNRLLEEEPTVIGIKTGTTEQAGQILLSQYHLNPEDVVIVIMGSSDRYSDTKTLISWIQDNYRWFTPDQLLTAQVEQSVLYLDQQL